MATLRGGAAAPSGPFPLLPLRNGVVFPGTRVTLPVGREKSVALLRNVHPGEIVAVVTQRDAALVDPGEDDLFKLGVLARVHHVGRTGDSEFRLVIEGLNRVEIARLVERDPYWRAEGTVVEEPAHDSSEAGALAEELRAVVAELGSRGLFANVTFAQRPNPRNATEAGLLAAGENAQVIQFNPNAALQKRMFGDGFVPNSPEFRLLVGGVPFIGQRGERLDTGEVRVYFVRDGDFSSVFWFTRG